MLPTFLRFSKESHWSFNGISYEGPDQHHQCLPEHGWFSCSTKGATKCMPINRACDGYEDCDNGSDEGGLCSMSFTPSLVNYYLIYRLKKWWNLKIFYFVDATSTCGNMTNCLHGCHKTPTGSVCSCPPSFRANGTACVGKIMPSNVTTAIKNVR